MSLGDDVRKYVQRKFGEYEGGPITISHAYLRYTLTQFTTEWLNTHETKVGKTYIRPSIQIDYGEQEEQDAEKN